MKYGCVCFPKRRPTERWLEQRALVSCSMTGLIEGLIALSTEGIRLVPSVYSTFMEFSDMACFCLQDRKYLISLHPLKPFL